MSTLAAGGPRLVVALAAAGELGSNRVGSKAFNLARLAAAGLPVPPGFVVVPEAFEAWEVAEPAVAGAVRELAADRYAVRSSAVAEDLRGASYAGMYETVLNVAAADVASSVPQVWESACADRVLAYRERQAEAAGPPENRADGRAGAGDGRRGRGGRGLHRGSDHWRWRAGGDHRGSGAGGTTGRRRGGRRRMGRARRPGEVPTLGRGCRRRRAGPPGRVAGSPRGGALRFTAGCGVGDRRRASIPASGPADDRACRAGELEPAQ
jgi:hypothetical protein